MQSSSTDSQRQGLPRIEAVSFVSASRVPQMADAEEVVAGITPRAGVAVAGLVLNERGYDRLVAAGLREAHFSFAVSESFNRRNQGASVEESLAAAASIIGRAREDGISSTVTLSTAFGCPFEGRVDPGLVVDIAARVVDAGPDEVLLADTIGVAVPRQVGALVADIVEAPSSRRRPSAQHAQHGICERAGRPVGRCNLLDASLGGIGGCPFAPRATGNIATEDLVYLLHGEGIETGVDLDALIGVAVWLEGILGEELEGQVYRAGPFPPRP